jgi:putative hydrolase of the HAD superfamily
MNNPITVVIFDLGRVLLDFDHRLAAEKIAGLSGKSAEEITGLFFDSDIVAAFEAGLVSPEEFFNKVRQMLCCDIDYPSFVPIWNEIFTFTEQNRRVHALTMALKPRYVTALLSNINLLHYEYIKSNFHIFGGFHRLFASCELGCVKPDPEIYRKALAALEVPAGQVFYTDDRPELISQARSMGIRGFVYTGFEQLCRDMDSCGINYR